MAVQCRQPTEESEPTTEIRFSGWYGLHLCAFPRIQIVPSLLILGAPGAGKSTLCQMLERTYNVRHIDLPRQLAGARQSLQESTGGHLASLDQFEWEQGANVPVDIALHCLLSAMTTASNQSSIEGYVISGYLGSTAFTRRILETLEPPPCLIYLESVEIERLDRLMQSTYFDVNGLRHNDLRTISKRLATYNNHDARIVAKLENLWRVHRVNSRSLRRAYTGVMDIADQFAGFQKRMHRFDSQSLADWYLQRRGPAGR